MSRRGHLWLLLLVIGCAPAPIGESVPAPPRRIVSLTLATDEILAELVPMERIAGVTYLVDDPGISNVNGRYPEHIPRLHDTNPEIVIGLDPDLVCVASYNSADFVSLLESAGLTVHRNDDFHTMDQIERAIEKLGKAVGETQRAQQLIEQLQARRRTLAAQLQEVKHRPRVLFWSGGFTAGQGTTTDDIIRAAGGRNVAAERNIKGSSEISLEETIAADPDIILVARWSAYEELSQIESHPILQHLRAVREGKVISIEGRYLNNISQHVIEGAERLARKLHPECFPEKRPAAEGAAP